ncbi:MAG: Gfo/Idh/MocA family protein, partial [Eubacterium sp.]
MKTFIKAGVIGLGQRGMQLIEPMLKMNDVQVIAVCDAYEDRVENAAKAVVEAGFDEPFKTGDYKEVLSLEGLDAVVIATSWERHIEIAIEAMKKGIFTAMEVGGTYNLQECFDLVQAQEETGTPFFFLENCCYGQRELMCLNMARQGVFGEIVHCDGAYKHDLRNEVSYGKENRHYRLSHYKEHNCENYPTHDLGPIAKILGINRG